METAMPRGMKIVIILYALSLFFQLLGLPKSLAQSDLSLLWTIVQLILTVVVIVGIYLRRGKWLILTWMMVVLISKIVLLGKSFSLSTADYLTQYSGEIAKNSKLSNLSPGQLINIINLGRLIVLPLFAVSSLVSLLIFIYVFKRRDYFK